MNILEHPRNKHIVYDPVPHTYHYYPSGDKRRTKEAIQFDGITGWISSFAPAFNKEAQAQKSSKNPYSDWYGMTTDEIIEAWNEKGRVSREFGDYIHKVIEDYVNDGVAEDDDMHIIEDFNNVMDANGMTPIRSEFTVFNEDVKRASPIDILVEKDDKPTLVDVKTFQDGMQWVGYRDEMFNYPLAHLPHSQHIKTSLQLSITQNWLERPELYDVPCNDHGYILLYTDHFELIPALYLPNEVATMEQTVTLPVEYQ